MKVFLKILKYGGIMLLGAAVFVGVISAVIGIASAVNHLSFGGQITEWFGSIGNQVVETGKDVVKATMKI